MTRESERHVRGHCAEPQPEHPVYCDIRIAGGLLCTTCHLQVVGSMLGRSPMYAMHSHILGCPSNFGMHSHTPGYPGIWECNPTWGCIPPRYMGMQSHMGMHPYKLRRPNIWAGITQCWAYCMEFAHQARTNTWPSLAPSAPSP